MGVRRASLAVWAVGVRRVSLAVGVADVRRVLFAVWAVVLLVWEQVCGQVSSVWAWGVLRDAVLLVQVCTTVVCVDVIAVVFAFALAWTVWQVRRLCDRVAVRHGRRLSKLVR